MTNQILVKFITLARKRGFTDAEIREEIKKKCWPESESEKAFDSLNPKFKIKNQVCIFLSNEILSSLEKRSKKNMLTLSEQVEDILRRSCISGKKKLNNEKLDDMLLACFSRKKAKK